MMSKNSPELVAVIPALNESESIASVINGVLPFASVIVVDDGSSDSTAEIARFHGAEVISHLSNRGYEAALWTGFKKAVELGFKYVITLDADGQHDPKLIQKFQSKLTDGYAVVVGVRNHKQRIGEVFFSIFSRIFWSIRDPLCGMKAYSTDWLLDYDKSNFDSIGTKYMFDIIRRGGKVFQISIKTSPRIGASRFGYGLRVNWKIIIAIYNVLIRYQNR